MTMYNETHLQDLLVSLLEDVALGDDSGAADLAQEDLDGASVMTFANAGLLTRDAGVVISLPDGAAFQVSIVRSARALGGLGCGECGDEFAHPSDLQAHLHHDHGWDLEDAGVEADALVMGSR